MVNVNSFAVMEGDLKEAVETSVTDNLNSVPNTSINHGDLYP